MINIAFSFSENALVHSTIYALVKDEESILLTSGGIEVESPQPEERGRGLVTNSPRNKCGAGRANAA
jgi:hypothetical protein